MIDQPRPENTGAALPPPAAAQDLTIDQAPDGAAPGPSLSAHDSVLRALSAGLPGGVTCAHLREPVEEPGTVSQPRAEHMPGPDQLPGRYQLAGEIARGGMGVVFLGRDLDLGRDIAVKIMLEGHSGRTELLQRFVEEAQIGGQLQHPGVVPVYELGQAGDKRLYFTMKLVKGQTLAALLAARTDFRQDLPRFLTVFTQVCQTLAYAHARGVIHRDLKPANIMVGAFGEVQVMDWGLAKVLTRGVSDQGSPCERGEEVSVIRTARSEGSPMSGSVAGGTSSQTHAGTVLGTPAYMSPEQACGATDSLDQRCDVFGLGALLCQILTGQPPYVGTGSSAVHRQAMSADLAGAWQRLDDCAADAELIRLAKACLAPDLADRPRHAGEVAAAMERYQVEVRERLRQAELERAEARVQAQEERKRREVERQKRRATLAAAAALVLLVVGASASGLWYQQEQERHAAEQLLRDQQVLGRREQAARDVQAALDQAAQVRGALQQALAGEGGVRKLLDQPAHWQGQLKEAALYLEKARASAAVLAQSEEGVEPSLARRVEALAKALAQDERDRQLAVRLEEIRLGAAIEGNGEFPGESARKQYPQAFAAAGLAVLTEDVKAVAERIRQSPIREQLVTALDDWAEALVLASRLDQLRRLWQVAGRADPDPVRQQFRTGKLGLGRRAARAFADKLLADEKAFARLSPLTLQQIGAHLSIVGEDAETWLRQAQVLHPTDFTLNYDLAFVLGKTKPADAAGYCRAALAVRPHSTAAWISLSVILRDQNDFQGSAAALRKVVALEPRHARAWNDLGSALAEQSDLKGAADAYRKAVAVGPEYANAWYNLANVLSKQDDFAGAADAYRKAVGIDPGNARAWAGLGAALQVQKDFTGAVAAHRKALELNPKLAVTWRNLGIALAQRKELPAAAAAYRKAVDLNARDTQAWYNLGVVLFDQGDYREAAAAYRRAADLEPKLAKTWVNLGGTLRALGDWKGAEAAFDKAIDLDPKDARAWYELGLSRQDLKDLTGAEAAYRKALQVDPQLAQAHCNLGHTLRDQGRFAEALHSLEKGHQLGSQQPDWHYPSAQWVQQCRQLLQVEQRALALLSGQAQPTEAAELLKAAGFCRQYHRPLAAARLYAKAFAAQPTLALKHRSLAATATARAAAGQRRDAGPLDLKQKADLRRQALDWLRADLTFLEMTVAKYLRAAGPGQKPASPLEQLVEKAWQSNAAAILLRVCDQLQRWQSHPDLASLRDEKDLAKLPPDEQTDWRQFWVEVRTLEQQARGCFSERRHVGNLTGQRQEQVQEVKLQAGKTYAFDLESTAFDPFLRLRDNKGKVLAENDDIEPGVILDSRIIFTPKEGGAYQLVATAFQGQGVGTYRLIVREFVSKK